MQAKKSIILSDFQEWLNDANELLDRYPSIYRHLDNGDYQFTIDFIREKIEPKEDIVTTSMVDEYATFLQVN